MPGAPIVIGLGEILWDLLPAGKQLGGAPTNFAYHVHCLSARARVVSAVGRDDLGQEILDALAGLELSASHIHVATDRPTGTVSVSLDAQGQPTYTIHEQVAWDAIPWSAALQALAAEAQAVCFGSLGQRSRESRDTIRRFLRATPASCLRVFDINLRQAYFDQEVIDSSLALADVLKLNEEELPTVAALLGLDGGEDAWLQDLLERYELDLIALTRGASGSLLHAAGERSVLPGTEVTVQDTVGAGDAFTAALVWGLLHERPLADVHAHASRIAAYVCTQAGATPVMPDELMALGC